MSVRLGGLAQRDTLAWLTTQVGGSSHLGRTSYLVSPRVDLGVKQGQPWLIPGSTLGSSKVSPA